MIDHFKIIAPVLTSLGGPNYTNGMAWQGGHIQICEFVRIFFAFIIHQVQGIVRCGCCPDVVIGAANTARLTFV